MSGPIVHTITGLKTAKDHVTGSQELVEIGKRVKNWYLRHTEWTITVSSQDRLYDLVHLWFTDLATRQSRPLRALEARFERKSYDTMSDSSIDDISPIKYYYDGTQTRVVVLDGQRIKVALLKQGKTPGSAQQDSDSRISFGDLMSPDVLTFYAKSYAGQQAVGRLLNSLAAAKDERKPTLWMYNRWGSWSRRDDIPPRPLDSVVLKEGQLERIYDDMQAFLTAEADYVRRGIPWHRGYLLHGEPGTGKTSTIAAIASALKLDLWYAPLGDLDKDTNLLNMISEVRPRGILLLEDIDVFHAAREREDTDKKASMAALLNALDGVSTPHGMISVLTSNKMEMIDPALLRPGRVDLVEEIGRPDQEQVKRLYKQFFGVDYPEKWKTSADLLTTAAYMEVFKRHMNDSFAAAEEIRL